MMIRKKAMVASVGVLLAGVAAVGIGLAERATRTSQRICSSEAPFRLQCRWPLPAGSVAPEQVAGATATFTSASPRNFADLLHLWRLSPVLPDPKTVASMREEMEVVFSPAAFSRRFPHSPNLIRRVPWGWQVLQEVRPPQTLFERPQILGEAHLDQLLACLAEVGIPRHQVVEAEGAQVTVDDLIESSRQAFVPDQDHFWSVVAFCLYRPDEAEWKNRFGERHSYNAVAKELVKQPFGAGPCAGGHTLYSLACLLQVNDVYHFLDRKVRTDVEDYLRRASQILNRAQLPSGAWRSDWAGRLPSPESSLSAEDLKLLLLVTGHHLDWACFCPPDLRPDEKALGQAARFIAEALASQGSAGISANYCAASHGVRALGFLVPGPLREP